jgi:hypothetical protein
MRTAISAVIVAAVALAPTAVLAQAQQPPAGGAAVTSSSPGKGTAERVAKLTAEVQAVDAANRTVTLKGPRGKIVTLPVGPEVKNFDQIKAGDLVVVRYYQALTLELKKGGTAMRERTERDVADRAKPGERPAAADARQVHVIADVIAVDPKTQTVTLRGPNRVVDLKVRDPKQFKLVKVGDQVEATYTEAAAISVEPAKKPAAAKK